MVVLLDGAPCRHGEAWTKGSIMSKHLVAAAFAALLAATVVSGPALSQAMQAATGTPSKAKDGRAAMHARQKQCGAEWKAAKAAGTVEKGMTWPKYWSACNKRLKAANG
jgi:hypothetical protein